MSDVCLAPQGTAREQPAINFCIPPQGLQSGAVSPGTAEDLSVRVAAVSTLTQVRVGAVSTQLEVRV